ncbi:Protein of unknown function [Pyronema omphalodes CBS 100304]|uniref:Uncharacterized protein n=1 Tax=Pyronema omphalodes (strain CBS 100304) TaxID=1076935 RepID=U4KXZ7_PYROM|nr:Protein of unknown function [Pyronema omphalodes CBS 100304]
MDSHPVDDRKCVPVTTVAEVVAAAWFDTLDKVCEKVGAHSTDAANPDFLHRGTDLLISLSTW